MCTIDNSLQFRTMALLGATFGEASTAIAYKGSA